MLKDYPRVSVIILNWNGSKDTIECLESLYSINYPNYNVVLVDNASTDNSILNIKDYCNGQLKVESKFFTYETENKPIKLLEFTEEDIKNITSEKYSELIKDSSNKVLNLIKNQDNYGFAKGNNIGIAYALNSLNPDYILLLNNDTVVDPEFLLEMVLTAESNEKYGFVGSKTYFYTQDEVLQAAGGGDVDFKHGIVNELASNTQDNGDYDIYIEMDYVGGACLLCKREVINTVGCLDSNFFMYWEDVNWCLTGLKHGYKSVYSFKSRIWHKYGASSASDFKIYYLNRNRIYVIKEHAKRNEYYYFLIYFFGYRLWYESLDYLVNQRDFKRFKCLIKGALDGLRGP
ncbi:glycosyltransferase family 2 protein [Methanobacterium spitsbergense]|uniref:Glycosyltransferase family 2 protein n=1 Tax=Methanobacterium spitsbergense TaxID=2874285 RepID=A0A8T5URD0_9EURY|nr:glycosyltransferase family 2 protein [Methanobacterium spitsbergense]MBZ2166572.1 glycosyltransferase family 2 protein [Methanobacterium spitsbergense]